MKAKALLLSFLLSFIPLCHFAQTSASESGIAIQGIAREADNSARLNEDINLTFYFYYKDGASDTEIIPLTKTVTTDDFGVFSTTVDPGIENNSFFSNNLVYLRISEGATIISDEKLKHVPYAVSANNGVPTGSIMPFVGNQAPKGWLFCDGSALPDGSLKDMIGDNAPDLRGMFIRGTGTSVVNGQAGPGLNETQDDSFELHNHGKDLSTTSDGEHRHQSRQFLGTDNSNANILGAQFGNGSGDGIVLGGLVYNTTTDGSHPHTFSTNDTGENETRPVNYGVNYIIKL